MSDTVKIQLSPRARLTCVRTEMFKSAVAYVVLSVPFTKETASLNALLPRVLARGTARLPDLDAISRELDSLYGAGVTPNSAKSGEVHNIIVSAGFLDDDFIPGGNQTERVFALLGEMLLNPATDGGVFRQDYVDSEKMNQIAAIQSLVNDKASYTQSMLVKNMCGGEPFGTYHLGTIEDSFAITPAALMTRYREIIDTAHVEIIYCGAAQADKIELAVRTSFAPLLGNVKTVKPATRMLTEPPVPEIRRFTEEMDVAQGILALGFRMGKTMLTPNYAALNVFNTVYGGGISSKLFKNVRERLSLCYYASSSVNSLKGVMFVTSGIDFPNRETAETEILAQLDAMRGGDITDEEMDAAKRYLVSAITANLDSANGLAGMYQTLLTLELPYTPHEYAALHETITKDEVVAIAKSVVLDSIFFLDRKGAAS